ncbi:alpha-hydroxy-acid oxidizing protein [Xinfangfangia sp. D13-10-4-6]|uniref:alpha-hydroxy acid oxidase n=1 Tax=Pseudogemmobacter hezensis TaxID=2737662 RepID=UPI0015581C30|nr:alpha-hydroxy acid oxidase [Pseudogemmobacter hezensis]NPD16624.1 alpha-hydroxy-acid oxidizing protein [Pseudogemmobacter hezensis]
MSRERRYQNSEDFRLAARKRLPKIFADYIEGGAFSETTLRRNSQEFERYALAQRVLHDLAPEPDLSASYLGRRWSRPFFPGPVGFLGLYRRDGDLLVGLAAKAAGVPFGLSTFSIKGIASLAPRLGENLAFQLYLDRDPAVNDSYLEACRAAGVQMIFLTVDTAITSVRERDNRNGFRAVTRITPGLAWQFAQRPRWSLDLLRNGFPGVELVEGRSEFGRGALAQASALSSRLDKRLTWDKVKWLRDRWPGRLVIKGIADPRDAEIARESGVDGVVLSNHGGRQLDHGLSTIAQVAGMRAALGPAQGSGPELFVDSGFRRGSDIAKALALGADAVMMGRPFAWAVAAEGQWGAARLIDLLSAEIGITLQLMGLNSVDQLKAGPADQLLRRLD